MTLKKTIALLAVTGLAACATSPPPTQQGAARLKLCDTRVSNAPQTNRSGYVIEYAPYKQVRGVSVARAPVAACLSSGFGPRRGGAGRLHKGIDLFTGEPRAIIAAAPGRIIEVGRQRGFGRTVLIRHRNGVTTRYAHLSSFAPDVREGARVAAGAVIGQTGQSGNATAIHLHYEILVDGKAVNPLG